MYRPQQGGIEFAFTDPVLEPLRAPTGSDIPHEHPTDVVTGQLSGGKPTDFATLRFGNRGPDHQVDDGLKHQTHHSEALLEPVLPVRHKTDLVFGHQDVS